MKQINKKLFEFKFIGRETFDSVMNWINFVKGIENPLIVLLANKIDLSR